MKEDFNVEIATSVIDLLKAQNESLPTLATAIIAGLLAMLFTLAQRNSSPDSNPILLKGRMLVIVALTCESICILLGYFVTDSLTTLPPLLYGGNYDTSLGFHPDNLQNSPNLATAINWLRMVGSWGQPSKLKFQALYLVFLGPPDSILRCSS